MRETRMERKSALVFSADHPAFAGHFPGVPIVPGVLLLDAVLHALAAPPGRLVGEIAAAKFLQPALPDHVLDLSCESLDGARVRFEISRGAQRVASGQLVMEPVT